MSWPADTDSADELLIARNNWWTTLPAGIDAAATEISISAGDLLQDEKGVVSIEDEVIYYAGITRTPYVSTLGGCVRGYDGTIAREHPTGARVELRWVADHHNRVVSAIRTLQTFLGSNLTVDALNGVSFSTLGARLHQTLPLTVAATGDPWVITHNRRRVVGVQLWVQVAAGQYELMDAPVAQEVNSGGVSTVTVTFGTNRTGYAVLL